MIKFLLKVGSVVGMGRIFKFMFNIAPMYRGTGAKVVEVSDDLHYFKIRLGLNYRTKNYVGVIYGGHLYSSVDGIYMIQLMNILGDNYVVWDKSASIRFRRPANQTLYAEFFIEPDLVEQIQSDIAIQKEKDYTLHVNLVDKYGVVYAEVEKVIYIASKEYYTEKRKKRKRAVV
ncbi:MAG: DUF4442 domain-containing protein [Reichenbachiella sp.]